MAALDPPVDDRLDQHDFDGDPVRRTPRLDRTTCRSDMILFEDAASSDLPLFHFWKGGVTDDLVLLEDSASTDGSLFPTWNEDLTDDMDDSPNLPGYPDYGEYSIPPCTMHPPTGALPSLDPYSITQPVG